MLKRFCHLVGFLPETRKAWPCALFRVCSVQISTAPLPGAFSRFLLECLECELRTLSIFIPHLWCCSLTGLIIQNKLNIKGIFSVCFFVFGLLKFIVTSTWLEGDKKSLAGGADSDLRALCDITKGQWLPYSYVLKKNFFLDFSENKKNEQPKEENKAFLGRFYGDTFMYEKFSALFHFFFF